MSQALIIAPSILSADFSCLGQEIADVSAAGADWIHVDVMDGHFVPNLTIGPPVVSSLRPFTKLPLDCHLMVSEPEKWVEPFAKAGADFITVHLEATKNLKALLKAIRDAGCKAGASIRPATSISDLKPYLSHLDLVLVMSVNPGFGGQKFMPESIKKIAELAETRKSLKLNFLIEVDGGVGRDNMAQLRSAGCDAFVAGSAIFAQKDRKQAIRSLREASKSV